VNLYGIDIETYDPYLAEKGASWVYGEGEILCVGIYSQKTGHKKAYRGNGGEAVRKLLTDPDITLVGTNIIYDLGWLEYEHHVKTAAQLVDVSIAEAHINEYARSALEILAPKYLNEHKGSHAVEHWVAGQGYKGDFRKHLKEAMREVPELVLDYVVSDADQPVRIWEKQKRVLDIEGIRAPVLIDFALIKVCLDMKQRGVRIDVRKRMEHFRELYTVQQRLLDTFKQRYGNVNFNSGKQLAGLFEREQVPYRSKIRVKGRYGSLFADSALYAERLVVSDIVPGFRIRKKQLVLYVNHVYGPRTVRQLEQAGYQVTCNPNIDKFALDAAKNSHEVCAKIVELKQVTSILDKFLGPKFERFIVDGRIHGDFNIAKSDAAGTISGRFSSANPNLQQIPSKTRLFRGTPEELNLAKMCRELIIPEEGEWLLKIDYSQIEYRLFVHIAMGPGAEEARDRKSVV
jgi:DNA polymerase-1